MSADPMPLDDATRAALIAGRAYLVAVLPIAIRHPDLRAGAVQFLGALEDALGMERTMPRREDRRNERRTG